MRRWTTWLLVGALAALGSVAVADALRGGPETKRASATPTISVPLIPRNEPAASAMGGTLFYSDRVDCRLRALRLPDLREVAAPPLGSCSFSVSPDGQNAVAGEAAWSPGGGLYAVMRGGLIELGSPGSDRALHLPGRAPAFKPDGTFTYALGNEVVEWTTACPRGARLFTLPADNATARCRRIVARVRSGRVVSLAWLTNRRMALITRRSAQMVTIREGRLHVTTGTPGHRLRDLRVSPLGSYVSARADRGGGLLVLGADGHPVSLPPFLDARSITWSPDERWTAVATASSVVVFRTETDVRLRRLPVHAYQVAWR